MPDSLGKQVALKDKRIQLLKDQLTFLKGDLIEQRKEVIKLSKHNKYMTSLYDTCTKKEYKDAQEQIKKQKIIKSILSHLDEMIIHNPDNISDIKREQKKIAQLIKSK